MPGRFITFEGGDAAGKSTQVAALAAWIMQNSELEVVTTFEPGATPLGGSLRQLLLHGEEVDPRAEALLYAADRAHHVATVVRPAVDRGAVVICDRHLDSFVAYQGAGRELSASVVEQLSLWATRDLLPDLTLLLDVPVKVAQRRMGRRDRVEGAGIEFHERVRQAFLDRAAAEPDRIRIVDASRSPEDVAREVQAQTGELIGIGDAHLG